MLESDHPGSAEEKAKKPTGATSTESPGGEMGKYCGEFRGWLE